ncbi:hypothetical protein [Aureibacter tunicatorum]|uniref:Uncharacterized protein n=1 Tax=Aureibacter tunicatorum TaxID=866807 RepID=A0AAE4BR97_9BACT|nr:hypothetical protein [Aureibacter tunicatorum]MDR6238436.1 hypothetical protein [Aureibacter tunicatorum]BDD05630.1 hypothetical protein AUTU_31130 [Aureibacter tunicatorum]
MESYEILYQTNKCEISYIKSLNTINIKWIGYASSDIHHENAMKAINFVKEKGAKTVISDNRKGKVISKESQEWGHNVMVPSLLQSKVKQLLIIESENIFNQFAIDQMIEKNKMSHNSIKVETFLDLESAFRNIKRQIE